MGGMRPAYPFAGDVLYCLIRVMNPAQAIQSYLVFMD